MSERRYSLLLVEDDVTIARAMAEHLSHWGYGVQMVEDFRRVAEEVAEKAPDLVLMDVALPFFNGFHWCSEIRRFSRVPILFVSSASDDMNVVMAVNMGGDDFIAKPFDLTVLTAKVQALLRRSYDFAERAATLEREGVTLDLGDGTLRYQGDKTALTKNEFRILQALMERPGRVVPREALMERLWEDGSFIDDNTLTVNVNRLRKKLAPLGLGEWIVTKKGMGYEIE